MKKFTKAIALFLSLLMILAVAPVSVFAEEDVVVTPDAEITEDESFLAALAMSEVKMKNYEEALKLYKQLAVLCPSKESYKYNVVTCYEALGDYTTAINMLEEML